MYQRIAAVFGLVIAIYAAPSYAATECKTKTGKEINPNHGNDTKGLSGWVICKYSAGHTIKQKFKKGKVIAEEWLDKKGRRTKRGGYWYTKNGNQRRDGKWQEWYENGTLKRIENYRRGDEHGPQSYFAEDGSPRSKSYYSEGKKLGEIGYNDDGSLGVFVCYEQPAAANVNDLATPCGFAGKRDPVTTYYEQGKKKRVVWYERGKVVAFERYHVSGTLLESDRKATGKKQGLVVSRHKNGKKKQETSYDDKGLFHGVQREFHESGKLTREAKFERGFMTKEKIYYLNGQLKRSTELQKRGPDTRVIARSYHDNGKLEFSGKYLERERSRYFGYGEFWNYRHLEPYGVHKRYRPDGTLRLAENYKDGGLEGVSVTMHENGKNKLYEDSYQRGRRVRHKEYDIKGRLIGHEEFFEDGSSKRHSIKK